MSFFRERKVAMAGLAGGAFGMVLLMALASVVYSGEGVGSLPKPPVLIYPNL